MNAIVFGSTGFIGSHVVEQLHKAGHPVTAVVRENSDLAFLKGLGVRVVKINFSNSEELGQAIIGNEVVYNCLADAQFEKQKKIDDQIEFKLTRDLIEAAANYGARRFVQLSTIVVYDFKTGEPIDESYDTQPKEAFQLLKLEKDRYVQETGRKLDLETMVLRPASTIGIRDKKSFFSRFLKAHQNNQFPLSGQGETTLSLIDTRDIGHAMVFLGTLNKQADDNGLYLVKGFDTTWGQLKKEIDRVTGKMANTLEIPATDESYASKTLSVNRLWNDQKIRKAGFQTLYNLQEAVEMSVNDLLKNKVQQNSL